MATLAAILLLLQVDPFKVDSKKVTPEISKTIEKLDALRLKAFEDAKAKTSAKLPEKFQIVLEAKDGADPDPAKFTRQSGTSAETSSLSDGVVRIRFFVEYFANGLGTPESTLRHEMVHAVMRLDLGREKYQKLPKWFREGVAVFIANQMPEKLNHRLMQPEVARDPESMLDGLEDADHTLDDYWEDAMGILFLMSRPMPAPFLQVMNDLRTGKDYKEAIAEADEWDYEDFVSGAREHALRTLKSDVERRKDMLQAYAIIARLNEKSGELCDEFFKKWPTSPLTSAVLYYKAKSAAKDPIAHFDRFLESARGPDGKVDYIDDAKLRKARLYAKEKKTKEAAEVYADLVYWHVGSSVAVDALYEWGLLEMKVPLLKRALEIAPKHRLAERASKIVGD